MEEFENNEGILGEDGSPSKFESLEEIADVLGDGGPFNPDYEYKNVEQLVDHLVHLGNTDKVFAYHDDHLGLKSSLPQEFLNSALDDVDKPEFEPYVEDIIEQAERIIALSKRELSEEDYEVIREDKLYRGESLDE